jgi:hypothetical protein
MVRAPRSAVATPVVPLTSSPSTNTRTYRRRCPVSSRILNRSRGYRSSRTSRRCSTESASTLSLPRGPNSRNQLSRCTSSMNGAGAGRALHAPFSTFVMETTGTRIWPGIKSKPYQGIGERKDARRVPRPDRQFSPKLNVEFAGCASKPAWMSSVARGAPGGSEHRALSDPAVQRNAANHPGPDQTGLGDAAQGTGARGIRPGRGTGSELHAVGSH